MFSPVSKQNLSVQIADSLREAIVDGRLRPGEALPSERKLALRFGVNRSSIREAILRLEVMGLVEIKQGEATRVRDFLVSAGLELLPFLMAPGGSLDLRMLRDLLKLRVELLAWTAEQAAQGEHDQGFEQLQTIASKLSSTTNSAADLQRLDFAFFEALLQLAGNRVLLLLGNAIRKVYMAHKEHFISLYDPTRFDSHPHRQTVAALVQHDAAAASAAMRCYARRALAVFGDADA